MTRHVIEMDAGTRAFYAGVAAAEEARAKVANAVPKDAPFDAHLAYFWLLIGQTTTDYTTEDELNSFLRGVNVRGLERQGFLLEFDTTGPAFHKHDVEAADYDEDKDDADFRAAVSRTLVRVASDVLVADNGDVYPPTGRKVGRWVLNDLT